VVVPAGPCTIFEPSDFIIEEPESEVEELVPPFAIGRTPVTSAA
jgi:formylglycine-generating enzyme required for sulfatase activity